MWTEGNGAREKIEEYCKMRRAAGYGVDHNHFLVWLWLNGYKVVPLDDNDERVINMPTKLAR